MEMEGHAIQSTLVQLSPWKKYKRRVDNVPAEGRLVLRNGEKLLEVKESKGDDYSCPSCKHLITQRNGRDLPNFFLEPVIFHETYKPVDPKP